MKRNFSVFAPTFAKKRNVWPVAAVATILTARNALRNGGRLKLDEANADD